MFSLENNNIFVYKVRIIILNIFTQSNWSILFVLMAIIH